MSWLCICSIKGKINAPPKDPDEQPVPRSLTRLFAFQQPKPDRNVKKKKNKHKQFEYGNSEQSNTFPLFLATIRNIYIQRPMRA